MQDSSYPGPRDAPVFAAMQPAAPVYSQGGYHRTVAEQDHSQFYLKKEPGQVAHLLPPCSSPSHTQPGLQPEFVDFFHPPAVSSHSQLTTLTNYIPFPGEFPPHPPDNNAPPGLANCGKFEADIESLNRVRRTILSTPQPM